MLTDARRTVPSVGKSGLFTDYVIKMAQVNAAYRLGRPASYPDSAPLSAFQMA